MHREAAGRIPAVGFENHHGAALEDVNVHRHDAGPAQAADDLRPDVPMIFTVRRNDFGIIFQVDREHVTPHARSITFCRDRPSLSMPSSTWSPAFRYCGAGFM